MSCSVFSPVEYILKRQYYEKQKLESRLLRDRLSVVRNLFHKDIKGHYGCVNALDFSPNGEMFASGGDDRRVVVWNTQKAIHCPSTFQTMKGEHHSNIFCLAFDNSHSKIYSGGNDEQVVVHDLSTGETLDVFVHQEAVYGVAVDPVNDNVFASACDDGRVLIYDIRAPPSEDPFCLANYVTPMHAVVYNYVDPRLLATANSKQGLALWDIRKPQSSVMRYGGSRAQQSCMSVRISRDGERLIALRRRLPPVLYNIDSPACVFQFDHPGYFNSCTMKSCCFAGDKDQYILSGSDDFNLYMWKIPEEPTETGWVDKAHLVLRGHRSIVNQVRWHNCGQTLLSSGVEKVIKMWSPFPLPLDENEILSRMSPEVNNGEDRPVYTHEEYINLVLHSGQVMSHDYSQRSTDEDPRMMAFFDSLVQRELEGWSSDDAIESEPELLNRYTLTVDSDNSPSETHSEDGDEDGDFSPFTIAFATVMAQRQSAEAADENDPDELPSIANREAADPDSSAAAVEENILPGQRHNVNRVSISSLIAQKREEYLSSVKKSELRARKKRRLRDKLLCSASRAKKIRLAQFAPASPSASDTNLADSSSSSDNLSPNPTELISKLNQSRERPGEDVLRLKRLRKRILNSDTESEDEKEGKVANNSASVPDLPCSDCDMNSLRPFDDLVGEPQLTTNSSNANGILPDLEIAGPSRKADSSSCGPSKGTSNESGLQDIQGQEACVISSTFTKLEKDVGPVIPREECTHNDSLPESPGAKPQLEAVAAAHASIPSTAEKSSSVACITNKAVVDQSILNNATTSSNGRDKARQLDPCTLSNGAANSISGNSGASDAGGTGSGTWVAFKKFKKRSVGGSRQYRRNSHSRESSSSDEN